MRDLAFNDRTLEEEDEVGRNATVTVIGVDTMGDTEIDRGATESRGIAAIPRKYSSTIPGETDSNNCILVRSPASQEGQNVLQEEDDAASEKTRESPP